MGNTTQATAIRNMERIVQGTVVNSTSGTSIDFTGIPSWAKKITVMFNGVSTNGVSAIQVQLGTSGGVVTTGYSSSNSYTASTGVTQLGSTTGLLLTTGVAASNVSYGIMTISNISSNTWVETSVLTPNPSASTGTNQGAGAISLGAVLDRIRITTVNGTDTFDAGQINIMYEG